ncbi:uncharacterized protein PY1_contig-07-343 [Novosphingobium sp. PY1]|uniref:Uncharacterized protein n=1 Tax=Ochrobactrum sp. PW1 TaxID=1882222 RepID=A0A292GNT4_9HYPH|nr:hypothetical protein [Ochrobactrum sp. PW1]GFM29417.1 uncharacterized protein PY1_contig-07-343 [Novosphingobium sp. PY1]
MEFSNADLAVEPLRFNEVGLVPEFKAAVDLFAVEAEGLARFQTEGVEEFGEETLEVIASAMRFKITNGD